MDSYDILVVSLSVLLGIFLILSIVIAVMTYRLIKTLHEIVQKGGTVVDHVEEIGQAFARDAGMVGLLRLFLKFLIISSKDKDKEKQ